MGDQIAAPRDDSPTPMLNAISLGSSFKSRTEAYRFIHEEAFKTTNKREREELQKALELTLGVLNTQPFFDSSLGGNEAINPVSGFNYDDDIVHPLSAAFEGSYRGMGRVYDDMYNRNQLCVHFMLGSLQFHNLVDYYGQGANEGAIGLFRGTDGTIGGLLKKWFVFAVGRAPVMLFKAPYTALAWLASWFTKDTEYPISKFCSFQPNMFVYYRMVNTSLALLASYMGISVGEEGTRDSLSNLQDAFGGVEQYEETPDFVVQGVDIIKILAKRFKMSAHDLYTATNIDSFLPESADHETGFLATMKTIANTVIGGVADATSDFKTAMLGGFQYISFRVNAEDNSSETFSNETGTSGIAEKMNGMSKEGAEKIFTMMNLKTGVSLIDTPVQWAVDVVKGMTAEIGLSGAAAVAVGNGFFDIPDIWKGASMSRSYSITIPLRAKYGTRNCIFRQIYVPLMMLLNMAVPRQIGNNMYTNPFYLRAYCKGQFMIPLGVVESMSVKRGAGDWGWSQDFLPTAVDVTLSIKDLSPVLYFGMGGSSTTALANLLRNNTSYLDYMATLAGLGMRERIEFAPRLKAALAGVAKDYGGRLLNPHYWLTRVGGTKVMYNISDFLPWHLATTSR